MRGPKYEWVTKMRRILGAAALTLLMAMGGANAATIDNLGVNPTSAQGNFQNAPGLGAFDDQVLFQLAGGLTHLTIASVTNTFASPSDFIANFSASVFRIVGGIGGGDDIEVIGPVPATANCGPLCQGMGGSALSPDRKLLCQLLRHRWQHGRLCREYQHGCQRHPAAGRRVAVRHGVGWSRRVQGQASPQFHPGLKRPSQGDGCGRGAVPA